MRSAFSSFCSPMSHLVLFCRNSLSEHPRICDVGMFKVKHLVQNVRSELSKACRPRLRDFFFKFRVKNRTRNIFIAGPLNKIQYLCHY